MAFVTPVIGHWLEREIAQWVQHIEQVVIKKDVSHWRERGARCSSVVRAFTHGAMGRRIDPSWGGPIELFLVLASAPQ